MIGIDVRFVIENDICFPVVIDCEIDRTSNELLRNHHSAGGRFIKKKIDLLPITVHAWRTLEHE
jgi:hypothetical protein